MQYILLGDVKNCNKCPLSLDIDGKCKMNLCRRSEENKVNPDSSKKPSWCPLKELPLHKNYENLSDGGSLKSWGNGWNACLDVILEGE